MYSLSDVGPSTWNKLPNDLKTTTNVNCFKEDIKKAFIELVKNQGTYTFCFYYFLFKY